VWGRASALHAREEMVVVRMWGRALALHGA
jgi:hypothetical protein